jgi:adenylate cyclase class IV
MAHFEIEIKSLLGSKEAAEAVKARMHELDPSLALISTNAQLNHYFEGGDVQKLFSDTEHLFTAEAVKKFTTIATKGNNISVRTRERDGEVLLVLKASIDEGSSENGVLRMEFEEPVSLSLAELDQLVLDAGFRYQAKWSRAREEYAYKGINVCFDKNAGYGYVAEFEKVIADEGEVDTTRTRLDTLMQELGVMELDQARLARMFAYYNEHWQEYYGTDKTFSIE